MAEAVALPHSPECERAVLGALLLDPTAFGAVAARLESGDFHLAANRAIFAAMEELAAADQPIDMRMLQVRLESRPGGMAAVGGFGYLAALDLDLPDIGHLGKYVEVVRHKSLRRKMMAKALALHQAAGNGISTDAVFDMAATAFTSIAKEYYSRTERPLAMPDALEAWLEELSERKEPLPPGARTGTAIDALLGDFARKKLYLIAGDPGTGKSALNVQIVDDCILAARPTMCFWNEMTVEAFFARWMAFRFGLDSRALAAGRGMTQDMWQRVVRVLNEMRQRGKVIVVNRRGRPYRELEAELKEAVEEYGVETMLLDHAHMPGLWPGERGDKEHKLINHLTDAMAKTAQALNVAVIANAQISRDSSKQGRPPGLTDLREGGEGPADGVMFMWRPPVGTGSNGEPVKGPRGKFILAKHRDGPEGWVPVIYDGISSRWYDDPEGGA